MIDVEVVKGWLREEDDLYDYDLGYSSEGDEIELESIPEGYAVKVVANEVESEYQSYGYISRQGFLVFSVTTDEGESETFKFPMGYESFDGWSFEIDDIVPTVKQEKVVTTWEWV